MGGQADRSFRNGISEVAGKVEIVFLAVADAERLLLWRISDRSGRRDRPECLRDLQIGFGKVGWSAAAAARIIIIEDAAIDRGRLERLLVAEDQVVLGVAAGGDIIVNRRAPPRRVKSRRMADGESALDGEALVGLRNAA